MSFSAFGLTDTVYRGVCKSGYTTPTEIQRSAIPVALEGRDIIGCAPTGTGKTAAFVLPILHILHESRPQLGQDHAPRALILTPTRELAQQIEDAVWTYGTFTKLRPVSIYGGVNMNNQLKALRSGADIVIATPGRLLDHLERRTIDLSQIEILVLDEADRMFDMGFIRDVKRIIRTIPQQRQTMMFSATMADPIRDLVREVQKDPHSIEIGQTNSTVDTVLQKAYTVPQASKMALLAHILREETIDMMLVFSRTKHGADKIANQLERLGVSTTVIHSNRSQSQRQDALDGFKQGQFKVLVATDIAARGIDVDGISHVVNYDTPPFAEDYIHRIGRTGRAKANGVALTFTSPDEEKYLKRIRMVTGQTIHPERYDGFNYPASHITGTTPEPGVAPASVARKRQYYRTLRF